MTGMHDYDNIITLISISFRIMFPWRDKVRNDETWRRGGGEGWLGESKLRFLFFKKSLGSRVSAFLHCGGGLQWPV